MTTYSGMPAAILTAARVWRLDRLELPVTHKGPSLQFVMIDIQWLKVG